MTPKHLTPESFADLRPYLFTVAYNMLGSVMDAEDRVQEAYLRWQRAGEVAQSPKAYLTAVTTRLCIDHLRSAKVQREEYIGPWLPEPLVTAVSFPATSPKAEENITLSETLSMAFLVLLESLSPTERAVFLLRQVFEYDYPDIAAIVDKSEANCRQMMRRARQHIAAGKPRFDVPLAQQETLVAQFTEACFSATHIAPQAQAWLKGFSHGRPLHIFPHACNLVNHQGQVLSLVTSHIGPNPLALVLPPLHFPDFITVDSPIRLTPHAPQSTPHAPRPTFHIGPLAINLQTAVPWHPIPPWSNPLDLDRIHNIVTNHPDFQPAVPLHLASQMQQALHNHDRPLIAQTARQLAGLGPGLTPAGDDFLVGVIYALFRNRYSVTGNPITDHRLPITNDSPLITEYCPLITAAATPHTTTLSANLLQAAARGEASQPWHDLITAQTSDACYNALTRILHTGHSSGADALLGFLIGTTAEH